MARKANKAKVIPLRITRDLADRLRAQAKREERTIADLMRLILSHGVVLRQASIETRCLRCEL